MTIEQILNKAFVESDLASGGLLNPDQAAKFVKGIIDQSVIIKECRKVPMKANKRQIDKITYSADVLQIPTAVGTAHTTTTKPTTSKVTLDAVEAIIAIDLGYDALEDSIEGKSIEDTIIELATQKLAYELDDLCLNGNTGGATGTYLDLIDGLFIQISSNVYDATGLQMSPDTAYNSLKILPSKYLVDESQMRFYVSHKARMDYIKELADIAVNTAFQSYLIEGKAPTYQGIPVTRVPALPTYDTGGAVMGSNGLIINPKNIIWGIHRDITWEMERVPRARVVQVTATMRIDFKLEEETACVEISKIKHST